MKQKKFWLTNLRERIIFLLMTFLIIPTFIFSWYNSGFPVVNANGETDDIHPYDEHWGQLLEKRTK